MLRIALIILALYDDLLLISTVYLLLMNIKTTVHAELSNPK